MTPIKILLVDDSLFLRTALRDLMGDVPHLRIAGECEDGIEVVPFLKNNSVDVIFMDVYMKYMDGFEATREVKAQYPFIKVIGFSSNDDIIFVESLKKSGVDGFICKLDMSRDKIISMIDEVLG